MFLWLATTTGARRGELTAVRWPSVDLQIGILKIEIATSSARGSGSSRRQRPTMTVGCRSMG